MKYVTVRIGFAWWLLWLYVPGVATMHLLGFEPDMQKVEAVTRKALRVRLVPWSGLEA